MIPLLWALACGRGASEPAPEPPRPSHFGTFHGLVSAVVQGDVDAAKWIARSLQEGEAAAPPGGEDALAAVGGALGFVQVADDGQEAAEGLAAAAVGCGRCHREAGLARPPMGAWTHHNAGLRLVLGAVFPPAEPPPEAPEELAAARAAWFGAEVAPGEDEVATRLAAALVACQGCHRAGR